jgi:hypothetical protein
MAEQHQTPVIIAFALALISQGRHTPGKLKSLNYIPISLWIHLFCFFLRVIHQEQLF